MKMEQSVPKHRHIKFGHRGITQKKTYNIQNMAKVWNQEKQINHILIHSQVWIFTFPSIYIFLDCVCVFISASKRRMLNFPWICSNWHPLLPLCRCTVQSSTATNYTLVPSYMAAMARRVSAAHLGYSIIQNTWPRKMSIRYTEPIHDGSPQ